MRRRARAFGFASITPWPSFLVWTLHWSDSGFGAETNAAQRAELKRRMKQAANDWASAAVSVANNDPRILNYFQDPDGSEMWSRWDMQESPPDILITNYSMLNIMLMRQVEADMFEKTRLWLTDPKNVFHLVVDELHSYRGTPGRKLRTCSRPPCADRLAPDSLQLRTLTSVRRSNRGDPAVSTIWSSSSSLAEHLFRDSSGIGPLSGGSGLSNQPAGACCIRERLTRSGVNAVAANLAASVGVVSVGESGERLLAEALKKWGLEVVKDQRAHSKGDCLSGLRW